MRGLSLECAAAVVVAAVTIVGRAGGDPPHDVASVFFVAKSENRNQVHYGVHLDATCAPTGAAPVFVYWRMLEHGPVMTESLLSREVSAYGLADQRVVERRIDGGRIVVRLRALPDRPIEITTASRDGQCDAFATMPIDGTPAALASVFVQLRWPFGVDYLQLAGRSLSNGHPLRERLER
jgi:hypothetical protein